MNRTISVMVMAAAAVVATGAPCADEEPQERVHLKSGMRELSLWGALDVHESDQIWVWLGADLGFMLSPRHELGPTFDLQSWIFNWDTDAVASFGGFYRYNIPVRSRRFVPFMGARAMGFLGDQREWDAEARVEGGVWNFLGENAAINLTGFYGRRFGPHCEWWYCPDNPGHFGMSIGVSVFF